MHYIPSLLPFHTSVDFYLATEPTSAEVRVLEPVSTMLTLLTPLDAQGENINSPHVDVSAPEIDIMITQFDLGVSGLISLHV